MTTEMMRNEASPLPVGLDVSKASLDGLALGLSEKGSRIKISKYHEMVHVLY